MNESITELSVTRTAHPPLISPLYSISLLRSKMTFSTKNSKHRDLLGKQSFVEELIIADQNITHIVYEKSYLLTFS